VGFFFIWKFIGNPITQMQVLSQHMLLAVLTAYRSIPTSGLHWQSQNSVFTVQQQMLSTSVLSRLQPLLLLADWNCKSNEFQILYLSM